MSASVPDIKFFALPGAACGPQDLIFWSRLAWYCPKTFFDASVISRLAVVLNLVSLLHSFPFLSRIHRLLPRVFLFPREPGALILSMNLRQVWMLD